MARNRANTGAPGKKNPNRIRVGISNYGGGNDDLPQNSLKARAPRNSLIINEEVI